MGKKEYYAEGNYQRFNKPDLKSGDIVTYRDGTKGIVFLEFDAIVDDDLKNYASLEHVPYDLNDEWNNGWDIVKVQRANYIHQFMKPRWDEAPVIWERQETVEMTLAEVCKALGKNVKIVKE